MFNRHDIDAPLTAHREAELREANGSKKHLRSLAFSHIHPCMIMYAWMSARMIHARMHVYYCIFIYACIKILRKILSVITPASFDRNCY